jgi:hypothetical protein
VRHKVSFTISAVASVILVVLYMVRARPAHTPPPPPPPADVPIAPYPLCKELDEFSSGVNEKVPCPRDPRAYLRGICRIAFEGKNVCEQPLRAAFACSRGVPTSRWICSPAGTPALPPDACVPEIKALEACLK